MIVLKWIENGECIGALVDCYSSSNNTKPLVEWLNQLGIKRFVFVAVTHPHLDHLNNLHSVLHAFEGRIDYLWTWPIDPVKSMMYFRKLAAEFPASSNQLDRRAKAVEAIFAERYRQFQDRRWGIPHRESFSAATRIYPLGGNHNGRIEVLCISPCDEETIKFSEIVSSGSSANGEIQDIHGEANRVSGGFLVQYGESQVILGGDMELDNWLHLIKSPNFPICNPCVVKVSHHGSITGMVDGMWGSSGFLGCSCKIAVITPWNRRLPMDDALKVIASSGCQTYVTGQNIIARDHLSRVEIQVFGDGASPIVKYASPSVRRISG